MTDVLYSVDWYLGSRYGGTLYTEFENEIDSFRNDKIAKYGAIFRMGKISKTYME